MRKNLWQHTRKWISLCLTILTLFTLLAVPAFAAEKNCLVVFDPDDDVAQYQNFFKIELPVGSKVTGKPADPIRKGYIFAGWYYSLDKNGDPMFWNFEEDVVQENTTLWAAWVEACIVAFDPDDDVTQYQDFHKVILPVGSKVTGKPVDPTRTGYLFAGWYYALDKNDDPMFWNFEEDVVRENTTLWAAWAEACTVTFDPNDGVTQSKDFHKVTLPVGGKITGQPSNPTREGYDFKGWYIDGSQSPWNFDSDTVAGDTTLKASWEKKTTPPVEKPEEKPEEKKPDTKDKQEGLPKTGDYDLYVLFGILLTLSATVMTVTLVSRKRRQGVR